jgi:hypothetical protein
LIIGNRRYGDPRLSRLNAPGSDAERLAQVLRDAEVGAFDNVSVLFDQSEGEVRRNIARFLAGRTREDLVFLYFSGHGVLDDGGTLFLATTDTEIDLLSATAVPVSFVRQELDRSNSRRQVVVLDCCNSGAFMRGAKRPAGGSAGLTQAFQASGFGRVVLTATDAVQFAWEGDQLPEQVEGSLFTHFLVRGLESGEADLNGDGHVSLDELYEYAYKNVVDRSSRQTPQRFAESQTGQFVIARSRSVPAVPLGAELLASLDDDRRWVREAALSRLFEIAVGNHPGLAKSALERLRILVEDDSKIVASRAVEMLKNYEAHTGKSAGAAVRPEEARHAAPAPVPLMGPPKPDVRSKPAAPSHTSPPPAPLSVPSAPRQAPAPQKPDEVKIAVTQPDRTEVFLFWGTWLVLQTAVIGVAEAISDGFGWRVATIFFFSAFGLLLAWSWRLLRVKDEAPATPLILGVWIAGGVLAVLIFQGLWGQRLESAIYYQTPASRENLNVIAWWDYQTHFISFSALLAHTLGLLIAPAFAFLLLITGLIVRTKGRFALAAVVSAAIICGALGVFRPYAWGQDLLAWAFVARALFVLVVAIQCSAMLALGPSVAVWARRSKERG